MEEDVRLSKHERLDASQPNGESLVDPDSIQRCQHPLPVQVESQKERPTSPARQSTPEHSLGGLPSAVIEHILYVADASTFASLALLNRKWRRISDSYSLYAHHLSQCPSFSLSHKAAAGLTLPRDLVHLKRQFFTEIRRNGFDVFLRPHKTLIKLISTSMSSSTAFPRGEAFRFAFSQNAQHILCISSSRIIVLDVKSDQASVKHELKIWRRPLHAAILDDGSLLAVASSYHQVNIYTLSSAEAKLIQNLKLNDVPRALALSPTGGVLAIAYSDMIEVYAVGESVLSTERRAVRCAGVDSMSFSSDGVVLLGSSANTQIGSLVTINVPFYGEQDAGLSAKDIQIQMWTTQILFPDIVQGYSHACLLPSHTEGEGSWILGFDNQIGAFRAIGMNNPSSGTAYFLAPTSEDGLQEHPPIMLPSSDCQGELVALGFQDSGIWVYGVPDRLDIAPVARNVSGEGSLSSDSWSQPAGEATLRANLDRLQRAVNRPKMLIKGHKMTDMAGIVAARWVRNHNGTRDQRRLAVVAPGGVDHSIFGEEDVPVDGGRILLLDFARSAKNGGITEVVIEIGEVEPLMLHEPSSSLDTEVELERRRTRLHRTGLPGRGIRESYPAASSSARVRPRRNSSYFSASSSEPGDGDIAGIPDTPYDNTQPRSQDTLRRAATAAAASRRRRQRNEHRVYEDRPAPPIFQIPHESDADNWVPPPPPYTQEPDGPLPEYLRRTLLSQPIQPAHSANSARESLRRSFSTRFLMDSSSRPSLQRLNTITGSITSSRTGRHTENSLTSDNPRRHNSFLRRRGNSVTRTPQHLDSVNEVIPPSPEPQVSPIPSNVAPNTNEPAEPNLISQLPPTVPRIPALVQQQPSTVAPVEPMADQSPNTDGHLGGWQLLRPTIPVSHPTMDNYLYSISSPNLQSLTTQPVSPDPHHHTQIQIRQDPLRPPPDHRTQSQDIRPSLSLRNRRVSTDPTHSTTSQSGGTEQWRRRIEEWNERTIYERSKKSRSKCRMM